MPSPYGTTIHPNYPTNPVSVFIHSPGSTSPQTPASSQSPGRRKLYMEDKEETYKDIHKGQLIGKGAMGAVYKCRMKGDTATYALKIVEVPQEEGKEREMVLQEEELLRSLNHPNIVPLVAIERRTIKIKPTKDNPDGEEQREEIWMVMEMFDGSLRGVLAKKEKEMKNAEGKEEELKKEEERKKRGEKKDKKKKKESGKEEEMDEEKGKWFKQKEMLKWMVGILSGLKYLHEKKVGLHREKIAHRDIKSDNVLVRLTEDGAVNKLCLADLGVARIVGDEANASTAVGTKTYMAPEVNEHVEYDPFAADMWSVGVLLCELAVGHPIPFPLLTEEKKKEKGDYSIILKLAEQCCSNKPEDRPTASELLETCSQQLKFLRG